MKLKIAISKPKNFGELADGSFTYVSNSHSNFSVNKPLPVGTSLEKHDQRKIMGDIESRLRSIDHLDCRGSAYVSVSDSECVVYAEFLVVDMKFKEKAEQTMSEIGNLAHRLKKEHPNARFEIRYDVYTGFPEVRLKPLLRKQIHPARQHKM